MDLRDPDFRMVCVNSNGYIYDYISVRVSSSCPMNVYKFPFDYQTCQIKFCLPIFNSVEIQIFNEIYVGVLMSDLWETMVSEFCLTVVIGN